VLSGARAFMSRSESDRMLGFGAMTRMKFKIEFERGL
jgi:hypothetical protein